MNEHAELSLAVARIMWPEYVWEIHSSCRAFKPGCYDRSMYFDYRTDDAGFKMAVWLAKQHNPPMPVDGYLCLDNPHRALAEAIKELGHV